VRQRTNRVTREPEGTHLASTFLVESRNGHRALDVLVGARGLICPYVAFGHPCKLVKGWRASPSRFDITKLSLPAGAQWSADRRRPLPCTSYHGAPRSNGWCFHQSRRTRVGECRRSVELASRPRQVLPPFQLRGSARVMASITLRVSATNRSFCPVIIFVCWPIHS
jgi:hypothetical protein